MSRTHWIIAAVGMVLVVILFLAACGSQPPASTPTQPPAPAPEVTPTFTAEPAPTAVPALSGQALVEQRCTACHTLDRVKQSRKSEADWRATVERMVRKGAALSAAEMEAVVQYLAQTYPR